MLKKFKIQSAILDHLQKRNFLKTNRQLSLVYYGIGNNLVYFHYLYKNYKNKICLVVILKHLIL